MTATPTPEQILNTPMADNDADATTIRGYLVELLKQVWIGQEGFSGKRPFGNSGWTYDLYAALGRAGHISYTADEDGYCEECDDDAGDKLITAAINALGASTEKS
jgi:hypothetical protein